MQQKSDGGGRRLPPRPEVGGLGAGGAVGLLTLLLARDPVSAAVLGGLTAVLSIPLFLALRGVAVFSSSRELGSGEVERAWRWLAAAIAATGVREQVVVLYAVKAQAGGIQLVQLTGAAGQAQAPQGVNLLIHKAAWFGEPVAERQGGVIYLLIPGAYMERIVELVEGAGGRVRVVAGSVDDVRLIYKLARNVIRASVGDRSVAAYLAVKSLMRMIREGLVVVPGSVLVALEGALPAEPPWVRWRVRRQLAREAPVEP